MLCFSPHSLLGLVPHPPEATFLSSAPGHCARVRRTISVHRTGKLCTAQAQCNISAALGEDNCLPLPLDNPLQDVLTSQQSNTCSSDEKPCAIGRWRRNRCAVISSGGAMQGSGCGPLIDSEYDTIFRTNSPVVDGYEQDVGSRTDVMVDNGLISRLLANETHLRAHNNNSFADEASFHTVMPGVGETGAARALWQNHTVAILVGPPFPSDRLQRIHHVYGPSFVVTQSPSSDNFVTGLQGKRTDLTRQTDGDSTGLSKGLVAIFDAMRICDQVDVFGYADREGLYHYWDSSVSTSQHSSEARESIMDEHRLLRQLSHKDSVPVCRRSLSGGFE